MYVSNSDYVPVISHAFVQTVKVERLCCRRRGVESCETPVSSEEYPSAAEVVLLSSGMIYLFLIAR